MTMPALIACSHGTHSEPGRAAISALVDSIRRLLPEARVTEAFVDVQLPEIDDVVNRWAPTESAIVVPLLLSTGFHTKVDIARAVGSHPGLAVATPALGPHPLLTDVLADRLTAIGPGPDDAIVLAAAGSSEPAAAVAVAEMAERLGGRLGRTVVAGYAAGEGPRIDAVVTRARDAGAPRVIAASYVLAPGFFADVIGRAGADAATAPLAPDDRLAAIVVERYRAALADLGHTSR